MQVDVIPEIPISCAGSATRPLHAGGRYDGRVRPGLYRLLRIHTSRWHTLAATQTMADFH